MNIVNVLPSQEKRLVRTVQFRTIFRVYLCLMRLREASTRDVQKAMGFPTPAQATYHLRKLAELGLVTSPDEGTYRIVPRKFGVLRFLFKVRSRIVPMSVFYMVFFACVTVFLFLRSPVLEVFYLGALIVAKEAVDTLSFFEML